MKQLSKKQKIIYAVIIAIILIGIIIYCTIGFNLGLMFSNNKRIDIYIGKDFSISDIKQIADETLDGKKIIQTAELLDDYASVTVKDASEEQIENFKTKIIEKYNISENSQLVNTIDVPSVKIIDVMKYYIFPVLLATIISAVYLAVRFRKQNIFRVFLKTIFMPIIIDALYFSIIAICRIPFNEFVMPIALFIYIITLIVCAYKFKKDEK